MSRYIVQPLLGSRGIPYYVVIDTATGKGLEGYGCETWARHRADELNRTAKRAEKILGSRNESHTIKYFRGGRETIPGRQKGDRTR